MVHPPLQHAQCGHQPWHIDNSGHRRVTSLSFRTLSLRRTCPGGQDRGHDRVFVSSVRQRCLLQVVKQTCQSRILQWLTHASDVEYVRVVCSAREEGKTHAEECRSVNVYSGRGVNSITWTQLSDAPFETICQTAHQPRLPGRRPGSCCPTTQ